MYWALCCASVYISFNRLQFAAVCSLFYFLAFCIRMDCVCLSMYLSGNLTLWSGTLYVLFIIILYIYYIQCNTLAPFSLYDFACMSVVNAHFIL